MNAISEDKVFEICENAFLRNGKRLKTNTVTDIKDTYCWSSIKALTSHFSEWGFQEDQINKFITFAVERNKHNSRFSVASLLSKQILNSYCTEVQNTQDQESTRVDDFISSHQWLQNNCGPDLIKSLVTKQTYDSLPNFIVWYKSQKIKDIYICLSDPCYNAIDLLSNSYDRIVLPNKAKLYVLRNSLSKSLLSKIKEKLL